jgi:hypothetical protein
MQHCAEFKKVLSATPSHATQCEIQAKIFLAESALFITVSLIFANISTNSQPYAKMI